MSINEILAEAVTLERMARPETPIDASVTASATSVAEAHFRAECEQVPVSAGNVTVFPIGMRPA